MQEIIFVRFLVKLLLKFVVLFKLPEKSCPVMVENRMQLTHVKEQHNEMGWNVIVQQICTSKIYSKKKIQ